MKGDFSRVSFDKKKNYSGVLKQQGRVSLDADWNELIDIIAHHRRTRTGDIIGVSGAPIKNGGFEIRHPGNDLEDLLISTGRFYVNGLLCELHPTTRIPIKFPERGNKKQIEIENLKIHGVKISEGQWVAIYTGEKPNGILRQIDGVEEDTEEGTTIITLNEDVAGSNLGVSPYLSLMILYSKQPDHPSTRSCAPSDESSQERTDLIYLDVWERHITAVEDPKIREIALGGPDTATRIKTVAQVKMMAYDGNIDYTEALKKLIDEFPPSGGLLKFKIKEGSESEDPCLFGESGGYRGLENRLYRVEIHDKGDKDKAATFKWSKDNGSLVYEIEKFIPESTDPSSPYKKIRLKQLGRDQILKIKVGDWLEISGDETDLDTEKAGTMVKVDHINVSDRILTLDRDVADYKDKTDPKVRCWDTGENTPLPETPITSVLKELKDGIQICFAGSNFKKGDYWLFPARALGNEKKESDYESPLGIKHHYCPLAIVTWKKVGGQWQANIHDCRPKFPSLTGIARGYSTNIESPGWYRIASNFVNGANALFTLRDHVNGEGSSTLSFRAGISNNNVKGISFTVLNHNRLSTPNPTFDRVRILSKEGSNEPQHLEVHVKRTGKMEFTVFDNMQKAGWEPVDWQPSSNIEDYDVSKYDVDKLFVVGDGEDRFTISRGGLVGIGTTDPEQKLTVIGGKVGIGYNNTGQTAALAVKDRVGIGTDIPEARLHVSLGNAIFDRKVSIGTTSPQTAYKLTVNGGGSSYGMHVSNVGDLGINVDGSNYGVKGIGTSRGIWGESTNGHGIHGKSTNGWAGYFEGKGYFSGKVGIGTVNPQAKLHVIGKTILGGPLPEGIIQPHPLAIIDDNPVLDLRIQTSPYKASGIAFNDDAAGLLRANIRLCGGASTGVACAPDNVKVPTNSLVIKNYNAPIILGTSSSGIAANAMTINTHGNVGIGTENPEAKLHLMEGEEISLLTHGYLIAGPTDGKNLVIDEDEIMARNNGETSPLHLQTEGGDIVVHDRETVSNINTKFIIKDNGNVGVGRTNPQGKLHVSGGKAIFDGDVGIGTLNPTEKLEVNGNVKADKFEGDGSGLDNLPTSKWIDAPGGNGIYYLGKVGIGTSTFSPRMGLTMEIRKDNPNGRNMLRFTNKALGTKGAQNALEFGFDTEGNYKTSALIRVVHDGGSSASFKFDTAYPGGNVLYTRIIILPDGKIGIGTNDPKQKLIVSGGNVGIGYNNTNQTAKLAINGKVGIGTIVPGEKLDVNGNINYSRLTKLDVADNFYSYVRAADFNLGHSSRRGSPGRALVDFTDTLHLNYGTDWVNGVRYWGTLSKSSSRELKENIADLTTQEAFEILENLYPVKFNLKKDKDKMLHLGFISEDAPDMVATCDKKAISNDHIVAILTKVVKEQQKTISGLQEKIKSLILN